jgi:hypothetical protein
MAGRARQHTLAPLGHAWAALGGLADR